MPGQTALDPGPGPGTWHSFASQSGLTYASVSDDGRVESKARVAMISDRRCSRLCSLGTRLANYKPFWSLWPESVIGSAEPRFMPDWWPLPAKETKPRWPMLWPTEMMNALQWPACRLPW
eukprot:scaffold167347_cov52-Prasinocladus_malaysianus.AAC.2